jgi:hypothetical protein
MRVPAELLGRNARRAWTQPTPSSRPTRRTARPFEYAAGQMHARRSTSLVTALLVAITVAACGSSSSGNGLATKSPLAILKAAQAAVDGAKSVHVAGSVTSGGTTVMLDLDLDAGHGASGTITESGFRFQLITIGKTSYIRAGAGFWRHYGNATVTALLAGKWIEAPPGTQGFAALTKFASQHALFAQLLTNHGKLVRGGTTKVNGQQVVALRDTTKGGKLFVATTGTPYPIEVTAAGASAGELTFSNFNAPVKLTPPPHPLNLGKLGASGSL